MNSRILSAHAPRFYRSDSTVLVRDERSSHLWLLCCYLGKNQTLELSRCAGMITTELFYNAAHHQFPLAMIAQLQAAEDRLEERLARVPLACQCYSK